MNPNALVIVWSYLFFPGGSDNHSAIFGFVEKAEVKRVQPSRRESIGSSGGEEGTLYGLIPVRQLIIFAGTYFTSVMGLTLVRNGVSNKELQHSPYGKRCFTCSWTEW